MQMYLFFGFRHVCWDIWKISSGKINRIPFSHYIRPDSFVDKRDGTKAKKTKRVMLVFVDEDIDVTS